MTSETTILTKPCFVCGEDGFVVVSQASYDKWKQGVHIQDAMPEMPAPLREQLMTGTHPKCWEEMFSGFGDEDELECDQCGSPTHDDTSEVWVAGDGATSVVCHECAPPDEAGQE
jgi:hypothetical protein